MWTVSSKNMCSGVYGQWKHISDCAYAPFEQAICFLHPPSRNTTLKQRRFNVDSTSRHWINVESSLFQRCVPAGQSHWIQKKISMCSKMCLSLDVCLPVEHPSTLEGQFVSYSREKEKRDRKTRSNNIDSTLIQRLDAWRWINLESTLFQRWEVGTQQTNNVATMSLQRHEVAATL